MALSAHFVELNAGRVAWHVEDGSHNVTVAWLASIGAEITARLATLRHVVATIVFGLVNDNRYGCRSRVATLLSLLILEGAAL
jgi:hypothetical protein